MPDDLTQAQAAALQLMADGTACTHPRRRGRWAYIGRRRVRRAVVLQLSERGLVEEVESDGPDVAYRLAAEPEPEPEGRPVPDLSKCSLFCVCSGSRERRKPYWRAFGRVQRSVMSSRSSRGLSAYLEVGCVLCGRIWTDLPRDLVGVPRGELGDFHEEKRRFQAEGLA